MKSRKYVGRLKDQRKDTVWGQLLDSSDFKNVSLQATLRMNLAQAILDGRIPAGTRLPSTRHLGSLLKVARITVALAYEALQFQGLLVVRQRSGHFVAEGLMDPQKVGAAVTITSANKPLWSDYLAPLTEGDNWLEEPYSWQSHKYPFVPGQIDRKSFPFSEWRECNRLAQATPNAGYWADDAFDSDDPFLIEQLCNRILPRRGISVPPEQVLITMGTQMGLYLISELLVQSDTTVAVEDPGHAEARRLFLRRGAHIQPLRIDDAGAIPPAHEDNPSLIYCTPGHQAPTGVVMSVDRRRAFLELAQSQQSLIIENDYEAETQFSEQLLPALKAIDKSGRVIYLGSFSNTIAPGLRIGYIVADRPLIDRARYLRRLIMRHPPGNNQRALALFIAHGHYERLIMRDRASLKNRAEQLTESLHRHLPTWQFNLPRGGSSVWVRGPVNSSMSAIQLLAQNKGILIEHGEQYFHSQESSDLFARIDYSSIKPELIDAGIQMLAQVVRLQELGGHASVDQ